MNMDADLKIAVVGGGIAGLAFALGLHQRGLACDVYEGAPEVKELGVGITLLPHAIRELDALGLLAELEAIAIENRESVFFNRWGQYVYSEARGRHAGYPLPELGIHRGKLHGVLWRAAQQRLGLARLHIGHRCVRIEPGDVGATLHFDNGTAVRADVVVACDGVNSVVRRHFFPDDQVRYAGINTWRGVTVHKPILTGKSYLRIGSIDTGKMVIYPIVDNVDGQGNQLINWVAEIRDPRAPMNDWNKPGRMQDFLPIFEAWRYDWLDVPALIQGAQQVFEYPMVDKDALSHWGEGRVTLMGDAAHPMYPRGSNGSAQALIDARTLADELAATPADPEAALRRYEAARRPATAKVVETNRTLPPDFIIMKADELSGGQPFTRIDDLISQDALREISENYKRIAGFSLKA